MKIINKKNFFPTVCMIYTVLSLSKILFEWLVLGDLGSVQINFLEMFVVTMLATFALSQHYRLQKLPFVVMLIVQYVAIIAIVMLEIWFWGFFTELHPNAYRDMLVSVTVPYIIGAIAYYLKLFREVKRANEILAEIKRKDLNESGKN